MINSFVCSKDNVDKRKELVKEWQNKAFKTGVKGLDEAFGGNLYTGSLWLICAGTGVGKTTALLATAKKMVRDGKKVAYITIEMSLIQILKFCEDDLDGLYLYEMESIKDWQEFKKECEEKKFDVVFYDYLGAQGNVGKWDEMIDFAAELGLLAIKYDIPIFTACQATKDINVVAKKNPDDSSLFGIDYISFSTGMANKIAGGIYIVNNNGIWAYNLKCRYDMKPNKKIRLDLDFKTKEWRDEIIDYKVVSNNNKKLQSEFHSTSII